MQIRCRIEKDANERLKDAAQERARTHTRTQAHTGRASSSEPRHLKKHLPNGLVPEQKRLKFLIAA